MTEVQKNEIKTKTPNKGLVIFINKLFITGDYVYKTHSTNTRLYDREWKMNIIHSCND